MSQFAQAQTILIAALREFITRNWALMSIATTIAMLVIIPALVLRKYVRIALNIIDEFAPPVWPEPREAGPIEGQSISFTAFDGHTLSGTMLPALSPGPRKGAVIFGHEFGVDRWCCHRYGLPLRKAGYDLFTFDFRGHGKSPHEHGYKPRQFPSDREQSDMLGAVAYVEDFLEQQGRPPEVGLFGLSRGAGAAILAAVGIDSVKAIAVDGAFSSDTTLEFHLKRWARIFAKLRVAYENHPPAVWRFLRWLVMLQAEKNFRCQYPSVRKAIKRLAHTPIYFIHGERDTYIPVEQALLLYHLAEQPKYLWTVPGGRHNQNVSQQPREYARRIVEFFDRHLANQHPPPGLQHPIDADIAKPLADRERPRPVKTTARSVR